MKKYILFLMFCLLVFTNVKVLAKENNINTIHSNMLLDTTNNVPQFKIESSIQSPYGVTLTEEFIKSKFTVNDIEDGNLLDQVIIDTSQVNVLKIGSYSIFLTVTDQSMNTVTATMTIEIVDTKAPVFTRIQDMKVPLNTTLSKEMILKQITVLDEVDGTITNNVSIDLNGYNPKVVGTYEIYLSVTDASNNTTTAFLNVEVFKNNAPVFVLKGNISAHTYATNLKDLVLKSIKVIDPEEGIVTKNTLVDLSLVNLSKPGTYTINLTAKDSYNYTTKSSIKVTITIPNYVNIDLNSYYSYNKLRSDVYNLEKYGSLVDTYIIGQSVDKRNIYAMRIGYGKKVIFISAGVHAREAQINTPILMKNIEMLVDSYYGQSTQYTHSRLEKLFNEVTFVVVPLVNPDGNESTLFGNSVLLNRNLFLNRYSKTTLAMLKANANGVDLNRNFPYRYDPSKIKVTSAYNACDGVQPKGPYLCGYPGKTIGSEPETKAYMKIIRDYKSRIVFAVDLHSRGGFNYIFSHVYFPYDNVYFKNATTSQYLTVVRDFANKINSITGYYNIERAPSNPNPLGGTTQEFIISEGVPMVTLETTAGTVTYPVSKKIIVNEYDKKLKHLMITLGENAYKY